MQGCETRKASEHQKGRHCLLDENLSPPWLERGKREKTKTKRNRFSYKTQNPKGKKLKWRPSMLTSTPGGSARGATRSLSLPPPLYLAQGNGSLIPGLKGPNRRRTCSWDSRRVRASLQWPGHGDRLWNRLWQMGSKTWLTWRWSLVFRAHGGPTCTWWLYSDGKRRVWLNWKRGCVCGNLSKHRDCWLKGPLNGGASTCHSCGSKMLILELNCSVLKGDICRHPLQLLLSG